MDVSDFVVSVNMTVVVCWGWAERERLARCCGPCDGGTNAWVAETAASIRAMMWNLMIRCDCSLLENKLGLPYG